MLRENIIVLDLETARSADDCRHCGHPFEEHFSDGACEAWNGETPAPKVAQYSPIGWNNKPALGLSVGCFFDYQTNRIHWFSSSNLVETIRELTMRKPLMVSFNGMGFDFVLMRGLVRRQAQRLWEKAQSHDDGEEARVWENESAALTALCDAFKVQCARSYDILAEIWKVDPQGKFERGINSLDSIAQANGLGAKLSHGALAPRDWAEGRWAEVLNYCQDDVYKTKALFEQARAGTPIVRANGKAVLLLQPREVATV